MDLTERKTIFTLAPVEDDISGVLKAARKGLLTTKGLSYGAKGLGCLILDLSMDRTANRGPGILVASDAALATLYDASQTALWAWKRELVLVRFVAIKKHFMPNSWPMTKYVLLCLHPDDEQTRQPDANGLWGNATTRGESTAGNGSGNRGKCSTGHTTFKKRAGEYLPDESEETPAGVDESSIKRAAPAQKVSRGATKSEPGSHKKRAGEPQKVSRGATKSESARLRKRSLPGSVSEAGPAQKTDNIRRDEVEGTSLLLEGKGTRPPVLEVEKAFKEWRDAMPKNIFDRELEKRKASLEKLLKTSADGPERQLAWRKLCWIHDKLDLGAPAIPAGKPKVETKAKPQPPANAIKLDAAGLAKAKELFKKARKEHGV